MSDYLLRLYIVGSTLQSERAIRNLRSICNKALHNRYRLEIIDVIEHPEATQDAHIIATPTLIKELPPPLMRIIGDMSNQEKVLVGLDLHPAEQD